MAPDKPRMVSCPRCGASSAWTAANPFRPFCSERCKLIDLGQWANDSYRIPLEDQQQAEVKDAD